MSSKRSYLTEFLIHPANRLAMMSAGCAAILASIPYGWNGMALVGVLALGIEALAALLVPDLPPFRAAIDRARQAETRQLRLNKLLGELKEAETARTPGVRVLLDNYTHMCSRVQELYQRADHADAGLNRPDVEKLDDLTVDYLGLGLLNISLGQREDNSNDETVIKRIATIQTRLRQPLPAEEERQLRQTLAEYTDAADRSRRLTVRRSALEARVLALPDKLEEVYQLVMTSPYSEEMGSKVEESLARLRLAEEVAAEFDDNVLNTFDEQALSKATAQASAPPSSAINRAVRKASQTIQH